MIFKKTKLSSGSIVYRSTKELSEKEFKEFCQRNLGILKLHGKNYGESVHHRYEIQKKQPIPVVGYLANCPVCRLNYFENENQDQEKLKKSLVVSLNERRELLLTCYNKCSYDSIASLILRNETVNNHDIIAKENT